MRGDGRRFRPTPGRFCGAVELGSPDRNKQAPGSAEDAPRAGTEAAYAHEAGAGVLHCDRDYDLIAEHTNLSFESVWLAPAGTL
jgi:hypothetical protein